MKVSFSQVFSLVGSLSLVAMAGSLPPQKLQAQIVEDQSVQPTTQTVAVRSDSELNSLNLINLPDGEHFYGEVTNPQEIGANYLIFRKEGETVFGIQYIYQSGQISCYQGKVNPQAITDADLAIANEAGYGDPQAPAWIFRNNETIDLSGFQKLSLNQIPATVNNELQECLQMDYTASR